MHKYVSLGDWGDLWSSCSVFQKGRNAVKWELWMQKPPATQWNFMAREVSALPICPAPAVPLHPTRCVPAHGHLANQSVNARPKHWPWVLVFINIFTDLYINRLDNSEYWGKHGFVSLQTLIQFSWWWVALVQGARSCLESWKSGLIQHSKNLTGTDWGNHFSSL